MYWMATAGWGEAWSAASKNWALEDVHSPQSGWAEGIANGSSGCSLARDWGGHSPRKPRATGCQYVVVTYCFLRQRINRLVGFRRVGGPIRLLGTGSGVPRRVGRRQSEGARVTRQMNHTDLAHAQAAEETPGARRPSRRTVRPPTCFVSGGNLTPGSSVPQCGPGRAEGRFGKLPFGAEKHFRSRPGRGNGRHPRGGGKATKDCCH